MANGRIKSILANAWMWTKSAAVIIAIIGVAFWSSWSQQRDFEKASVPIRLHCAEFERQMLRMEGKNAISSGRYTDEFLIAYDVCLHSYDEYWDTVRRALDYERVMVEDKKGPPMLSENCFFGLQCAGDCSGHEAGFDWAVVRAKERSNENNLTKDSFTIDCQNTSESFAEGCDVYMNHIGLQSKWFGDECI